MIPRTIVELALAALLTGCAQFASTIPDRQRDVELPPAQPLSLADEVPPSARSAAEFVPPAAQPDPSNEPPPRVRLGRDERFSVDWRATGLAQALMHVAETAGVNLYVDPTIDRTVDLSLRDVTLDQALDVLLDRNGLCLREQAPNIYWVEVCDGTEPGRAKFFVQSIDAAEIEPRLRALVDPTTRLVVDGAQNLVLVDGSRRDVAAVSDYLAAADRLKRQVLVEARVLEVTLGEDFELGIDADVRASFDGDTLTLIDALRTPDQSFSLAFDSDGGSVQAALQAIARHAGVHLISAPRVLAVTNTQARIEVVREIPYVETTTTTTGSTGAIGTQTQEEVKFKEAGIVLAVTPIVQEGGVVRLKVEQELSEVSDFFNEIPVLDRRELASEFQVENGGTIVLGGLMQDRRSEVDKGVPLLMDLPLLGRLFRSDEDRTERRELLVLLTPRIVDPTQATELSRALSGAWRERVGELGVRGRERGKP